MKRRLLNFLPFLPAVLLAGGLFALVGLSKPAWRGAQGPDPSAPSSTPEPFLPPPAGFRDWKSFEYSGVGPPRLKLPLQEQLPSELWPSRFMRAERELWDVLAGQELDPDCRTLGQLRNAIRSKGECYLTIDEDLPRDTPLAVGPERNLAAVLRATALSEGLFVIPSDEPYPCGCLTRYPRAHGWPRTWPLVRVLKALRGEAPDATEQAWLALERPAPAPPPGDVDVHSVANWVASATGLPTEYSEEARGRIEVAPALRVPAPEEGDTVESCARVALVRAGLDVAARRNSVLICRRGEADALAAGRMLSRAWTPQEWSDGNRLLRRLDAIPVSLRGGRYPLPVVIKHIANACSLAASMDDTTWDDPTLVALPEGTYTVRELREQLWTSAGVRTTALKESLWFVEPPAP